MPKPHYPGRPLIDAYGNGGFRFADMSHQGSILILPSGVYGWHPDTFADFNMDDFMPLFEESAKVDFLLLGTGEDHQIVPASLHTKMRSHGINLDIMSTGAAARTWNVVLSEKRRFAAALIAVK
jgi:uncharacterized protein